MSAFPVPFYTPKEYLEKEVKAEFKSEYWDGQIYAMAGGSPRHSELGALFTAAAVLRLKGKGCGVFTSDLRIFASSHQSTTATKASTHIPTYPLSAVGRSLVNRRH